VREHDIVARFGGEESDAVLPGSKSEDAIAVAERIRQSCHDTQVAAPNGQSIQLSTS
jgi:diguanylate cyclase (GGDEF)-like protein